MPPEQIKKVDELLNASRVVFTSEVFTGCKHGWTMKDLPVFNEAGDQKHWGKMLSLFERKLKN